MIADVGHPRGPSLSNGFDRTARMVVIAMVGVLDVMAVPNLLGQWPKDCLNGAAHEGSAGG
jgi:Tfp pilus assembly protein FimT